jgi:hypothetical protein
VSQIKIELSQTSEGQLRMKEYQMHQYLEDWKWTEAEQRKGQLGDGLEISRKQTMMRKSAPR